MYLPRDDLLATPLIYAIAAPVKGKRKNTSIFRR